MVGGNINMTATELEAPINTRITETIANYTQTHQTGPHDPTGGHVNPQMCTFKTFLDCKPQPSRAEDAGSQPTATTGAAVGSNVEEQQVRDQRSQATAQDKPRFRRRKSITRRKKRTYAISSDSEPDSPPQGPKGKPGASMPKDNPKNVYDLQHIHTYVPVVKWRYSRLHKEFTLSA
ncbi:hypothetical protein E3N88_19330 [Mikania micrantha]|uniref:Uncharacterized protein n=1 Tax=Mikania micrantha TaxID=192012 RepID=A0A5N6NNE0_9ASTR|nr:hypothetical protein E3N88_19330 [Mikania micrantha]